MMGRTHAMGGLASLWLLNAAPSVIVTAASPGNVGVLAVCAVVGALFPDLDAGKSLLSTFSFTKKGVAPFALPSQMLRMSFGHRGPLHSLIGWIASTTLVGAALWYCLGWPSVAAFSLGFLSHLALDCMTPTGLTLFWPSSQKSWLLPKPLRIVTGSPVEDVVFVAAALAGVTLLLSLIPR